jgi:hypothetical protein
VKSERSIMGAKRSAARLIDLETVRFTGARASPERAPVTVGDGGLGMGDGQNGVLAPKKETEIEEFNGIHDEFYTMLVCFCLSVLMCFFRACWNMIDTSYFLRCNTVEE